MPPNRVIFLDIDGVLNCSTTSERLYGMGRGGIIGLDMRLVPKLTKLVKETGADIVLSSCWRHKHDWREIFEGVGLTRDMFVGVTPDLPHLHNRGEEIEEWLQSRYVDSYAIIDDEGPLSFLPHQFLFQTTWEEGLTDDVCLRVKNYLLSTA